VSKKPNWIILGVVIDALSLTLLLLFSFSFRFPSYTQELPDRFKKDIMKAATTQEHSDRIALEGMQRVLVNIGASHVLTTTEMKLIFEELGNGTGEIPAQSMTQIMN
jgi:hypothetical protein